MDSKSKSAVQMELVNVDFMLRLQGNCQQLLIKRADTYIRLCLHCILNTTVLVISLIETISFIFTNS